MPLGWRWEQVWFVVQWAARLRLWQDLDVLLIMRSDLNEDRETRALLHFCTTVCFLFVFCFVFRLPNDIKGRALSLPLSHNPLASSRATVLCVSVSSVAKERERERGDRAMKGRYFKVLKPSELLHLRALWNTSFFHCSSPDTTLSQQETITGFITSAAAKVFLCSHRQCFVHLNWASPGLWLCLTRVEVNESNTQTPKITGSVAYGFVRRTSE